MSNHVFAIHERCFSCGLPANECLVCLADPERVWRLDADSKATPAELALHDVRLAHLARPLKVRAPGPPAERCVRCGDKIKDWEPDDFCWKVANGHVCVTCADATGKPLPHDT